MLDFESVRRVRSSWTGHSSKSHGQAFQLGSDRRSDANTAALLAGTLSPRATKAAPIALSCLRAPSVATTTPSQGFQVRGPYRSLQHLSGRGTREIHREDPVLREADALQELPLPLLIVGVICCSTAGPQGPVLGGSDSFQLGEAPAALGCWSAAAAPKDCESHPEGADSEQIPGLAAEFEGQTLAQVPLLVGW